MFKSYVKSMTMSYDTMSMVLNGASWVMWISNVFPFLVLVPLSGWVVGCMVSSIFCINLGFIGPCAQCVGSLRFGVMGGLRFGRVWVRFHSNPNTYTALEPKGQYDDGKDITISVPFPAATWRQSLSLRFERLHTCWLRFCVFLAFWGCLGAF